MSLIHRNLIVTAAFADAARELCAAVHPAGAGMFTVPLSPAGELPATHWISSGLIEQEFADLLASPDALAAVATQAGLDPAPLVAIVAASDISEEPADVALARLGLRLCQQEPAE